MGSSIWSNINVLLISSISVNQMKCFAYFSKLLFSCYIFLVSFLNCSLPQLISSLYFYYFFIVTLPLKISVQDLSPSLGSSCLYVLCSGLALKKEGRAQ